MAMYEVKGRWTGDSAAVQLSATGALVAALPGHKIKVFGCSLMSAGTVNVKFQSASTDKTGLYYLVANVGFVLPPTRFGHFETAVGEALNLNLSGAVAVGGVIQYAYVGAGE